MIAKSFVKCDAENNPPEKIGDHGLVLEYGYEYVQDGIQCEHHVKLDAYPTNEKGEYIYPEGWDIDISETDVAALMQFIDVRDDTVPFHLGGDFPLLAPYKWFGEGANINLNRLPYVIAALYHELKPLTPAFSSLCREMLSYLAIDVLEKTSQVTNIGEFWVQCNEENNPPDVLVAGGLVLDYHISLMDINRGPDTLYLYRIGGDPYAKEFGVNHIPLEYGRGLSHRQIVQWLLEEPVQGKDFDHYLERRDAVQQG